MRYRKKPVEVEAWQVGSDEHMPAWVEMVTTAEIPNPIVRCGRDIWAEVHDGDWVIRETEDDQDVISAGPYFDHTYEVVE